MFDLNKFIKFKKKKLYKQFKKWINKNKKI